MRYRIAFAASRVGQADCPPFELETPEGLATSPRTADLARKIRGRIIDALTAAPAPGSDAATPVLASNTQVLVNLDTGEGYAYYGTTTRGRFDIYPIH